jgi:hypothetical protein
VGIAIHCHIQARRFDVTTKVGPKRDLKLEQSKRMR